MANPKTIAVICEHLADFMRFAGERAALEPADRARVDRSRAELLIGDSRYFYASSPDRLRGLLLDRVIVLESGRRRKDVEELLAIARNRVIVTAKNP
jgi:hypothetical protein